jgi:hypothetical protein
MHRRGFLVASAVTPLIGLARAEVDEPLFMVPWRRFAVTTRVTAPLAMTPAARYKAGVIASAAKQSPAHDA